MRRLYLLLMALLTLGVSGAWADETFTIIDNESGGVWPNGSYSNTNTNTSSNWQVGWTSTSTSPQITVSTTTYLMNNSTGQIATGGSSAVYTISITGGYITGYDITFSNVNTNGENDQTITPSEGGSAATAEGANSATVNVTGLHVGSTTFTLSGNNTYASVTSFKVYYETSTSGTWSSGVPAADITAHYSTIWYVKLTSPNYWDVFFDTFELTHKSDGSSDFDGNTYLAFTYNKFSEQNNHKANEFIAISSNYSSRSSSVNTVSYTFPEKVRLNGGETVYVCFVSSNGDGTYNLQKRGIGVKSTTTNGTLYFCNSNTYTTSESNTSSFQCHYTCNYTTTYDYPATRIWSGINNGDKTSGGVIAISYMKYTSPGTEGQYLHFDKFSLSLRNSSVEANTYLLFSTHCLTATGVTTETEFTPDNFTAISTNCVPSADYGKVFTFSFDSDSYLAAGQTYYVYMGVKSNGNYCLRKYGLYINHEMSGGDTGFESSTALETAAATTNNKWQAIYYSDTYTTGNLNDLLSAVYTPINAVQAKLGSGLGQYSSPNYTTEEITTALSAASTASEGSDINAKISSIYTLRAINDGFGLNMPTSGMFLLVKGGNSGKYVKYGSTDSKYSMGDTDKTAIFYYDGTHLLSYSSGIYWGVTGSSWDWTAIGGTGSAISFLESNTPGRYFVSLPLGTSTYSYVLLYDNSSACDRGASNDLSSVTETNYTWLLETVTTLPVTFVGEYASFYSPVDLTIPEEDVEVYTGTLNGEWLTLNAVEGTLPANTGVILRRKSEETTTVNFTVLSTVTSGTSALTGTVAAAPAVSGGVLVLGKENDTWGIYNYTGTLGGFKAYMTKTAEVKGLRFDLGTATSIDEVLNETLSRDAVIYNAAGQRLVKLQHGLNLVNGKKVLIK